jgi:hypothetical protein
MLMMNDDLLRVAPPSKRNAQQNAESSATHGATLPQQNNLRALAYAALKRNDVRNSAATDTQKDAQQNTVQNTHFVAQFEGGFQPPSDPLNPTGDPELARLLSLPPGERLVALVQARYLCQFEDGKLAHVVRLADIEGEPEAPTEDQHQGDTDTGRVCCGECARFRRNRIGDPVHGIGRCSIFENPPGGPLWPKAERRCSRFVSIASDGGEA